MRGIDLARYRFDFDLTFAVLLLHPDGHVYHRYGARDVRGANVWLSAESFARVLETTLDEHELYTKDPAPPVSVDPVRLEEVPAFAERDQGKCIHCHNVLESLYRQRANDDRLRPEDLWVFPTPDRIGIDLDRDDQRRVTKLTEGSPAALAGLAPGDHILRIGDTAVATASDVMFALDQVPATGGELTIHYRRGETRSTAKLALPDGWRTDTPLGFSWRPLKWGLDPVPGFGGPLLTDGERTEAGLDEEPFAFRIDYFVTWGPRAYSGRRARKAGLREGDLVYQVNDLREFASIDHFHAWWRLTRKPGDEVTIHLLRDGERREIVMAVGDVPTKR